MTITSSTDQNLVTTGDLSIPLLANPRYRFRIDLESATYQMTIHWNTAAEAWYLDLEGLANDVDIKGIRLSTGVNLLRPFAIPQLGALYVIDATGEGSDPDFDNAGSRYNLYYVPTTNPDYIF